jgi:hypothetical protein
MVSPSILDDVCRAAIGWVKDRTDRLIRDSKPAEIRAADFHKWFSTYLRKHDRDHLLASFAPQPDEANIQSELRVRTYVRQLDVIDCASDDKLRAVSDYLMAAFNRTIWSDKGLVFPDSLTEFDDGLARHWALERQRTALLHSGRPEPEQGRLLYLDVIGHQANLEGKEVPVHFVPGSVHALADRMTIGWHPRYETVLRRSEEEPADA